MFGSDVKQLRKILKGTNWDVDAMGALICPCGYTIEKDGKCPEGCVSILRQRGLI